MMSHARLDEGFRAIWCHGPFFVWDRVGVRGWSLTIGIIVLSCLSGCGATMGQVVGHQFISSRYAFAVHLPEDEWQVGAHEPSVLTLTHHQLAAGVTINVTCEREGNTPLDILTRHLFFGFKDVEVLRQEPQALNSALALKTVARARLDTRELFVSSYIMQHHGCIYDLVYFASPQDFPGGESDFEQMVTQFRFLK
jgi:hypothetical protein